MHGSFEKTRETGNRIYRNWGLGFFALPVLIVIALVAMAMSHQGAANWISEAAQAEFVGANPMTDVVPTQLAQPKEVRPVRAN